MAANVQTITLIIDGKATNFSKVIKDLNKTEKNLNEVAVAQTKVATSSKSLTSGIRGMAASFAGIVAGVYTAKVAFDALREAANYENMITASKQLSQTTGLNYLSVADSISAVTKGAITFEQALKQANLGLSAGLTGTQLTDLAKGANKAALALGISIPDALNRITQATVKGSVEMLDELGIIVNLTNVYKEYAAVIGIATAELTTHQKLVARNSAITGQLQQKFGDVEIVDNPYEKLIVSIDKLKKEMLNIVSIVAGPLVDALASSADLVLIMAGIFGLKLVSGVTRFTESLSYARSITNSIQKDGYLLGKGFLAASKSSTELGRSFALADKSMKDVNKALDKSTDNISKMQRGITKTSFVFQKMTSFIDKFANIAIYLGLAYFALKSILYATNLWSDELSKIEDTIDTVSSSLDNLSIGNVILDTTSLKTYTASAKKLKNVVSSIIDDLNKVGKALGNLKNISTLAKIFGSGETAVAQSANFIVDATDKATAFLSKTKEGKEALKGLAEQLQGGSIAYTIYIKDAQTAYDNLLQKVLELQVIEGRSRTENQRLVVLQRQLALAERAVAISEKAGTKSALLTTSLKEQFGITTDFAEALLKKDKVWVKILLDRIKHQSELLGSTNSLEAAVNAVFAVWGNINVVSSEIISKLQTMTSILSKVLGQFAAIPGAQRAAEISAIQSQQVKESAIISDPKASSDEKTAANKNYERGERVILGLRKLQTNESIRDGIVRQDTIRKASKFSEQETITTEKRQKALRENFANQQKADDAHTKATLALEEARAAGKPQGVIDNALRVQKIEAGTLALLKEQAGEIAGTMNREKERAKGGGAGKGGGGAKAAKISSKQAEIELAQLQEIRVVREAIIDNEYASFAKRKEAALDLYHIEEAYGKAKLAVIQANIDDARSKGDRLAEARALTAYAAERAGHEKDIAEARRNAHDASTAATKMELPDMAEAGRLFGQELQYIWHDMMEDLDNAFTMLANTVMDVFTTATHALSEAIVYGGNDFAEKISDALKQSATQFLDHAFQLLGNMAIQKIGSLVGDVASTATDVASDAATVAAVTTAAATQVAATATSAATIATAVGTGAISITGSIIASTTAIVTAIQVAGITSSIPSFASGGIVTEPTIAMIGDNVTREEAVIPLDSGAVPVVISGNNSAGTNNVTTNIVVNNDGSTNSNTKADGNQGKALGDMINQAVRAVLVNERRSGGLLT